MSKPSAPESLQKELEELKKKVEELLKKMDEDIAKLRKFSRGTK
jgi:Skp family chaperone for outer membrane proteins